MKKLLLILLLCLGQSYAQETEKRHAVTTSQTGGRFELIQSELKRNITFKLDKYTGKVYVFAETKDNNWFSWVELSRKTALFDTVVADKINYQLFIGGTSATDCFLMNINTGLTWILVTDRKGNLAFDVFE